MSEKKLFSIVFQNTYLFSKKKKNYFFFIQFEYNEIFNLCAFIIHEFITLNLFEYDDSVVATKTTTTSRKIYK